MKRRPERGQRIYERAFARWRRATRALARAEADGSLSSTCSDTLRVMLSAPR